ncbi:hypothetical protein TcWFU_001905 [Taenia crassiceps]|uniref:RRM domain-containing protein n=1 Tax=Taenia crassiceps TaxID=6207 RepID=A0ABR4QJY6_9CEST
MLNSLPASVFSKEAASDGSGTLRQLVLDGLSPQAEEINIRNFFKKFGASADAKIDKKKHQALITFAAGEAHQVSKAIDAIRSQGECVRLSIPDWRTSANNIRSLFGRFGTSTKVEVDEQLHQALVTVSNPETFQEIMSLAPFRLKGAEISIFILGDQNCSKDITLYPQELLCSSLQCPVPFWVSGFRCGGQQELMHQLDVKENGQTTCVA